MKMKPLAIEIIAYAPTAFFHCTHCELVWKETGYGAKIHGEQLRSGLPQDLQNEYADLSAWINKLIDRYWDRISIRLIDAASPEGFLKSARHRLRNFPTIIVNGSSKYVRDLDAAEADIARRLASEATEEQA